VLKEFTEILQYQEFWLPWQSGNFTVTQTFVSGPLLTPKQSH